MSWTGTLEDCVKDFSKAANTNAVVALAEFCNVTPNTAFGWLSTMKLPAGEAEIKLREFLRVWGDYSFSDEKDIPQVTKDFGSLIAHNLLMLDEAKSELRYSSANGLYDVILRGAGLLKDKEYRMTQLVRVKKDDLTIAREILREQLEDGFRLRPVEPASHQAPSQQQTRTETVTATSPALAAALAGTLQASAAIIEDLDGESSEDSISEALILFAILQVGPDRVEALCERMLEAIN